MDKILGDRYALLEEGTVWPIPEGYLDEDHSLEWKMRYATLSKKELLVAASYLAAYGALIGKTNKRRNQICNAVKTVASKPKDRA